MIEVAVSLNPMLGMLRLGPIEFAEPIWLALIPVVGVLIIWIGRKSLSGMGTTTRRVALVVRLLVLVLLSGAMAQPAWRARSDDVAVTVVLDASKSVPGPLQKRVDAYVEEAASQKKPDDQLGLLTAAKDAYVQALPSKLTTRVERRHIGSSAGTNLAEAVRLAIAVMRPDAANRIVLATDGNETEGSLLDAASAALAVGIPIDVLPLRYRYESEVIADKLIAPNTARMGETIDLRVVLTATRPVTGRLTITANGEPIDLDPDSPAMGVAVALEAGTNPPLTVPITVTRHGPQRYEAVFEPDNPADDKIVENNRAMAVTFVTGEGKVLVYREDPAESEYIVSALTKSKIAVDEATPDSGPGSLTELSAYDAIVLVNTPSYGFSLKQQDELRQYVHDVGGGLVMIGGPESFGAGGWIGSPVEEALPIRLDPPNKRQMPRGALVMVIHSVELPNGVFLGKQVCNKAVDALSRLDLAGIIEDNYNTGAVWVYPLQTIGDRSSVKRKIKSLSFGDMPAFGPSLKLAYKGLANANAGQKHVIIISDGDPSPPSRSLLRQFAAAKITITTVGVATHGPADVRTMRAIAKLTGGRYYQVDPSKAKTLIPEIITKEAITVKRSLIWEGDPFRPAVIPIGAEPMRGIRSVPPISGYIVAADREGLSQVTMRGKENDPIAAQWQYGLGRTITFTSDATGRWSQAWLGWGDFDRFWTQQVRWAMKPSGSATMRVTTHTDGDMTRVVVEALDEQGERLEFARFVGRVARPDGTGEDLTLTGGLGRFRGSFRSDLPGTYLVNMRYAVPRTGGDGGGAGGADEGTVQAAVTIPFVDEYRTLKDNEPLLLQVAELTGGRVLSDDPASAELWSREGLARPVTTTPIWMGVALAGIGLFLFDVAVRRVRIDVAAMARAVDRAFRRGQEKATVRADELRAARAKARLRMDEAVQAAETATARETSSVKYEAPEGNLYTRSSDPIALSGEQEPQKTPTGKPEKDQPQGEEGLSRLLKAKKRAQEELEDQ